MPKKQANTTSLLTVRIISPKEIIFQGQATSVSSKNESGPFDILSRHANFITIVEKTPIIVQTPDKKSARYVFPMAIVYTRDNLVDIYTDIQI